MPSDPAAVHSGREIHHDQGGRIVVAMTDRGLAEAMREHFVDVLAEARADPDTFEVREVDHLDTAIEVDGDPRDDARPSGRLERCVW